ncbi:MAG TPA: polysaccharide deacetylase family protein, partial [Acidimicrobiia bacterium]|nr:polysaccharide deacetylase family protein [Acidimicrobiia bacterium]
MTSDGDTARSSVPRRAFLAGAVAAVGALAAACGGDGGSNEGGSSEGAASTTVGGASASSTATVPTTPASTAPARFVVAGPTTKPRVALTFHTNGDLGLANQLLDVFDTRHVKMTSFIVGDWLEANPDMAKRIADGGHEFANHTSTHPSFLQLSRDAQLGEVLRCRDVLVRLTGGPGVAFRPSGTDDGTLSPGDQVLSVAAEAGYGTVLGFDVDPFDYDDPGAAAVTERTLAAVHPGAIVSLHF